MALVLFIAGCRGLQLGGGRTQASRDFSLTDLGLTSCQKLRLRLGPLRGVEAATHITKGDIVGRLKRNEALEVTDLATESPVALNATAWRAQSWECRLAAMLLTADRPAWLASLPQDYSELPVFWGDQAISYEPLARAIPKEKAKFEKSARVLEAAGFDANRARWALATVRTRTFSGPAELTRPQDRLFIALFVAWLAFGYVAFGLGTVEQAAQGAACAMLGAIVSDFAASSQFKDVCRHVLAPGFDLINHNSDSRAEVEYEYFRDCFTLRSDRNYRPGEQLAVTYGPKSNADLLLNYGFVEADNIHDTYIFPADHPEYANLAISRSTMPPDDSTRFANSCDQEAQRLLSIVAKADGAHLPTRLQADLAKYHAALLEEVADKARLMSKRNGDSVGALA